MGLGNPGPRYEGTRHNVGFLTADELARRSGGGPWVPLGSSVTVRSRIAGAPVVIAKPQAFMNRSGHAVAELKAAFGVETTDILVIHDDLDLPFGRIRVRPGGGHGGHNGLRSIVESLETGEFARVKVGIGRPERKEDVVDYVLAPFAPDEESRLDDVLDRAASAVEAVLREGVTAAMNRFNA